MISVHLYPNSTEIKDGDGKAEKEIKVEINEESKVFQKL